MGKKINIGVLFGGQSVEHEVSLQSARNVIESLDRDRYSVTLIGINKEGAWHLYDEATFLLHPNNPEEIVLGVPKKSVDPFVFFRSLDVVFPVLHGTLGEDGTVQGVLKLIGVPFVGASVLGSAIGLDKDVMKRILRDANIPIPKFLTIHQDVRELWPVEKVVETIPLPFFVKPANGGSSVGISKVKTEEEFEELVDVAFQYDRKIIIEEAIEGREVECSVLGNKNPEVSLPCEIIPNGEFHSYSSKYIDPEGAEFIIPAEIELDIFMKMRAICLKTFSALCCEGMARIDMFLKPSGEVLVNEINTIPGLTNMSPYAKMWQASGLAYPEMIDRLVQLSLERHAKEEELVIQVELKELWVKR